MVLTDIQREICRLLADRRIEAGESYLAGGSTLNELLGAERRSRDIDLFHDTASAVEAASTADRARLTQAGFALQVVRERPGYVEVEVAKGGASARIEWTRDSSFRFFPLLQHDELGLTLHPFDLATNKVLALVGRLEARDWIDTIECDRRLQPFGYLAWAACGKDPGFGPGLLVDQAAKNGRYSQAELAGLDFGGENVDAVSLTRQWHELLAEARRVISLLPAERIGGCVLLPDDELCRLPADELGSAIERDELRFHFGRIGGALPNFRNEARTS